MTKNSTNLTSNDDLSEKIFNILTNYYQKHSYSLHHDTITGTSKQYILDNYDNDLNEEIETLLNSFEKILVNEKILKENKKIEIILGNYFNERANDISLKSNNLNQYFYLLNFDVNNYHHSHLSSSFYHITLKYDNQLSDITHKYISTSSLNNIQYQFLHSIELNKEISCNFKKKCSNYHKGLFDKTIQIHTNEKSEEKIEENNKKEIKLSKNEINNQVKLIITTNSNNQIKNSSIHKRKEFVPYFMIEDNKNHDNHDKNDNNKEIDDNDRKYFEEFISYLVIYY